MQIVSVIIPAFNASSTLEQAVRSIFNQECALCCQIVIINDGSTDNTKQIAQSLNHPKHELIVLDNQRAKGPSGARNTGLDRATGDFIAFLDADDCWHSNHLSVTMGILQHWQDIDIAFSNVEIIEHHSKISLGDWFSSRSFTKSLATEQRARNIHLITGDMISALSKESFMHVQSMVIRRNHLEDIRFNEHLNRAEDRDFSIQLALNDAIFCYSQEITGTYYRYQESLTSESTENALLMVLCHIALFTGYLTDSRFNPEQKTLLKELTHQRLVESSYYYRQLGLRSQCFKQLARSFRFGISIAQCQETIKTLLYSVLSLGYKKEKQIVK
ncbi:glycosyltransferase family 2 protein [Psychrobium sp. 1_MG-2023]|uniref:glycosyltransferase family 2 protein n=1 Tax=Psychrobium sp. 1_MG-2023 TaxID=3062624 RepID=UPI000C341D9E|nr:glycosyltransferase family 2 protein [Psychrobium sp. 1_MG-2023]MDP2561709.1 glycosyltransferase family 2 protein [Psychrobium sp. 1_MG-2023]PKF57110.1 hypothetical protein CW748_08465 [Alteromonadales bacterium alter-6D02]